MFFFHADGLAIGEFKVQWEGGCFRYFQGVLTIQPRTERTCLGTVNGPAVNLNRPRLVKFSCALNVRPVAFS